MSRRWRPRISPATPGSYDTSYDDIVISEDLDDLTIVHEVSHAWFNDSLFQERWVGEGLAEEYAARILSARSGAARQEPVPLSPVGRGLFQLNDWPRPSTDRPNEMYEAFGYNTSWAVMRAIVDDVTEAKMRDVFEAAAAEKLTYVGAVPAESSGFVPDWRRFLDIVEDVGGATQAEELFAAWVALPAQRDEMTTRTASRTRYFALVEDGAGWLPGIVIRDPMSNWRFAAADDAMAEAEAVLADRDTLATAATALGLEPPTDLENAYETANSIDDLRAIDARLDDWIATSTQVAAARDALGVDRTPLVALGLLDARAGRGLRGCRGGVCGRRRQGGPGRVGRDRLARPSGRRRSVASGPRSGPASPAWRWSSSCWPRSWSSGGDDGGPRSTRPRRPLPARIRTLHSPPPPDRCRRHDEAGRLPRGGAEPD